ncbi:uncharacterized protein [Amphiura filiformis]|uniref:uncharacterized protein n=1 Tax=Amphiura filiformis TaxID=82378 RepID=UPI003B225154
MAAPSEENNTESCALKSTLCVWNNREISPPPTVTCSYVSDELKGGNPEQYCELLSNIIPISKYIHHFLASERFTLTRLLFKLHNQQNRFKWYQLMTKIDKVLVRIENISLTEYVEELKECCYKNSRPSSTSPAWHMCSRQMHQYFLVKLMSISKLCGYTTALCEQTAVFLVQFLSLGHMVSNNLVFCSLISRIWVLLQSLLSNAIKWYDKLHLWCTKLKATAVPWLPSDECLPESLSKWLASDSDPVNLTKKSKTQKLLSKWFREQEETNTSDVSLLDNTGDDIKLDTASFLDLGEPISVLDQELLPDSGVSQKDQYAVEKTDNRNKKKKKRKSTHEVEPSNNDEPDGSCKPVAVPLDQIECSDASKEHTNQIRIDVSGLVDKDAVNIISSPRKKRKRKHSNHRDVDNIPEVQVTPASTEDGSTSRKKRNLAEAQHTSPSFDKYHLSVAEDKLQLSPNTLKKVEEEIIKSNVDVDNVDISLSCDERVKKKKRKKKKRKFDSEETCTVSLANENNTADGKSSPISSRNTFEQIETDIISATLCGQEHDTVDADSESVMERTELNADDIPKKKKKKKRKRKSDQVNNDMLEVSNTLQFSKTRELPPSNDRTIETDIMKNENIGHNEKQVSYTDDETGIQREEEKMSELSHKKKKRKKGKSGQGRADMGISLSASSGGIEISHQDAETSRWHETTQIGQDSKTKSSRKKKRQSDPVLEEHLDRDEKITSEHVHGDTHTRSNGNSLHRAQVDDQANIQYKDDHSEVLQGKKSRKKRKEEANYTRRTTKET